jgi:AmmeMemoRadiSam system protein A/AmmeMemoRadiSam system protein B
MIQAAFAVPHPPIIIPEVGRGRQTEIQKTIDAYDGCARQIALLKPDTIILVSPHSMSYADYIHISSGNSAQGDLRQFDAADVNIHVNYDTELVTEIEKICTLSGVSAGTLGQEKVQSAQLDHGTIIPLYFVNKYYKGYKLVRIGISELENSEHYELGLVIARTAKQLDRKVVFIASGDLSHKLPGSSYGYSKEGEELDAEIIGAFADGDFLRLLEIPHSLREKGAECGLRTFIIMAGALDKTSVSAKLLSYEGTFGIGYAVASFVPGGVDSERNFLEKYQGLEKIRFDKIKSNESEYVKLARYSLENFVKTGEKVSLPENVSAELLNNKAGAFVCIKKHGQLRGCIGTIAPVTESVAHEILLNAVSAAAEDPRFDSVVENELDELVYTVDVLSAPEKIEDISQLEVKRYGVIVTSGRKRGLLLPNLDGVDTVEQQLSIAKQKAGISDNETVRLERFEVARYE